MHLYSLVIMIFSVFFCSSALSQKIEDFTLLDHSGQSHRLSQYQDSDLVVLFVQKNGDAVSQNSIEPLQALRQQFERRNVKFFLINATDSQAAVVTETNAHGIDFPVLMDRDQLATDSLDLTISGEAIVVDVKIMEILYRGPVNDQVDFVLSPTPARNHYLRDALNNILLGSTAEFEVPPVRGAILNDNGGSILADQNIREFSISIPDAAIEDLRRRLMQSRLPDQISGTTWEYGTDISYLKELVTYWQTDFDWRKQEAQLNQFDQFKTDIDGVDMHFIHHKSKNPNAIPLLLVHGWPGSVSEFNKIIGPLTNPADYGGDLADSFHVIAPSLPGFGFSGIPSTPGYGPEKIAHILAALMAKIGYEQYAIAGGDWGAIINRYIANNYSDRLIGLHSNMILAGAPSDENQRNAVSPQENEARIARGAYMENERAYQQIQGTKPQSLGYGLNDSPIGLAAWIVEKFHGWTDMPQGAEGNLDDYFTKDELLTNVSIYWFTQTITSSMRIYFENSKNPVQNPITYINVPTGAAIFPAEIFITPRAWAEAAYNIVHWSVMPEGGHFAALEQPDLYVNDLREFFRLVR